MFFSRRTLATIILSFLFLFSTGVVFADVGSPLDESIFRPNQLPPAGGVTDLEMPFNIQLNNAGNANALCISHPDTLAPVWPASAVSVKGDLYTMTTGGNLYCEADEVEYMTPAASPEAEYKEKLTLNLSFGPMPAGSSYTFSVRQIECTFLCGGQPESYDVVLEVYAPTAIQLDDFGAAGSDQYALPATMLLLAVVSLASFLWQRRHQSEI